MNYFLPLLEHRIPEDFEDIEGSVPDHCDKANIVIKCYMTFLLSHYTQKYIEPMLQSIECAIALCRKKQCTFLSLKYFIARKYYPSSEPFASSRSNIRRRQWQPIPVLFPGKSHGWRSLVGCSPWGLEESDTTERLHFHFSLSGIAEGNGNPLQCSCLENPRDGGAWWAAVYGVAQSWTWLTWLSSSSRSNIKDHCHHNR